MFQIHKQDILNVLTQANIYQDYKEDKEIEVLKQMKLYQGHITDKLIVLD
jgi:hypothetical protein